MLPGLAIEDDDTDAEQPVVESVASTATQTCVRLGNACNEAIIRLQARGRDMTNQTFKRMLDEGFNSKQELVNLGTLRQTVSLLAFVFLC